MKKMVLLFMLVCPLFSLAQYNDIYFVPKKEKKVIVAASASDNMFVDIDDARNYVDVDSEVVDYVDDAYEYNDNDDYRYSTRIVRFRSPDRLVASSLYWDLRYNCGLNDWLIYDDGYTIDIYPAYDNSVCYWPGSVWTSYNSWRWNVWHGPYYGWNDYFWYHDYWGCHYGYPSYHWNHYPYHNGHFPPFFAENSWRPAKRTVHTDIPLNNGNRRGVARDNDRIGRTNALERTGKRNEKNSVRQSSERTTDRVAVRPESVRRNESNNSAVTRRQTGVRTEENSQVNRQGNLRSGEERAQQRRSTSGAVRNSEPRRSDNRKDTGVQVRKANGRSSSTSVSRSGNSGNERRNTYRRSSSSDGYNRPSSTSVSRQRTTSGSSYRSSSSSRSGSSSRNSRSGNTRSSSRR